MKTKHPLSQQSCLEINSGAVLHSSRLLVLSPQSELDTNKELPSDQFKLQISDLFPTAIFTL